MKKRMNIVMQAKIFNVIVGAFICIVGIILLITYNNDTAGPYLKWVLGSLCLLLGGSKLLGYFSNDLYRLAFQFDLTFGIFISFVGVLIFVVPADEIMDILPHIFSIYVILDGSLKFQIAIDARRFGMTKWLIILLTSIVICLAGAAAEIGLFRPLVGQANPMTLLGVALIADGCENCFVTAYTVRIRAKNKRLREKMDV